ncbi:tripartite tricarboxylate transporter substrate binding protein [Diaphorobacter sp. HDW4A]|uniref:Bug family tripartite tricarboxylate transporter substrate binding protein n=1 Tax=Diaphorobacter sp. HDW4A TaxID=2714924 RepID=UPI00140C91FF|nr:tripartite tricarboxylate transporter substrate binding protein [Diaphorobacter sp. HDW4A]QIL83035.1 tripartite tricarboxylate transporter substrate binding protein [Diaphorobacter sp. HDW4A]
MHNDLHLASSGAHDASRRRWLAHAMAMTAAAALSFATRANDRYPAKPIRLLVGFPPGGGADFVARQLAQHLGQALNASIVVENKPGANGVIAASEVARATADGLTLLLGVTASQTISPVLSQKVPYDPLRDFTPITNVGSTPLVLVVNPKLPVKNAKEFVAYVNASAEPVPYGSAGAGNITHMAAELFIQNTGLTKLRHIPYKGSSQVLTDLLGGHVAAYFDTLPSSLPYIQSGQLRALGVSSRERSPSAPDIPTLEESGITGYQTTTWFGLFAPPRLTPALTQTLNEAALKGLGQADARKALTARGIDVSLNSPERFRAEIESELERWRNLTSVAKISLD